MNTQDITAEIGNRFAALMANAADDPEPTPEEIEAERLRVESEAAAWRQRLALGKSTGWPEKYLEAVKEPPQGQQWLEAFDDAKACVNRNGILVLYGKRGCGKTRMAAELAVLTGLSRYRTAMRFFLEVRATFRKASERSELDVIDDLAAAPLLVLDEIQERGETSFEDRLLTHVIDARYASNKPTVMIANLTKRELADSLGASIVDRARENGKSIEFSWESFRGKTKP